MKFMNEFLHLKLAIKFIFFHAITNQSHAVEGEICRVEFIHELLSSESSAEKKIPQLTFFLTRRSTLSWCSLHTDRHDDKKLQYMQAVYISLE